MRGVGLTFRRLTFEPVPLGDLASIITRLAALLSRSFALRRAFSARVRRLAARGRGAPNDAVRRRSMPPAPSREKNVLCILGALCPIAGGSLFPPCLPAFPPCGGQSPTLSVSTRPCRSAVCANAPPMLRAVDSAASYSVASLPARSPHAMGLRRVPSRVPRFPSLWGLRYAPPPTTRNNPTAQRAERANRHRSGVAGTRVHGVGCSPFFEKTGGEETLLCLRRENCKISKVRFV